MTKQRGDTTSPGKKITLAAIGRRAGVSEGTVSKVLNGRTDVAPETRARVQALLDAYGYVGSRGRQDMARSSIIDILMIKFDDPWAATMLTAFDAAARRFGMEIVPTSTATPLASDELVTRILARGTRGIVSVFADLNSTVEQRLRAAGVAYVTIAPATGTPTLSPAVMINFRTGVRTATQHLIERGHKRIGLLVGARGMDYTEQRVRGHADAIRRARLPYAAELVRAGWHDEGRAYTETTQLLTLTDRPTAIIAGSDTMAIGVYRAAREAGLTVGADLAVVGFDGRPESAWLSPRLSTVRLPLDQLANNAIELLLATNSPSQTRVVEGTLDIQASSSSCLDATR